MADESLPGPTRATAWTLRLSLPVLTAIGGIALAGVMAGGFYAYRTYDYVQHDNDFCMSCHLMAQPYEQFAKSAHQGIGCKACHQPTLLARTQMALTQMVENPSELSAHAEVPNERCAECHIEGDRDKWRLIANTAGHRVHLESDDPRLGRLECVQCHSTSVHEFAPIDRTCAQAGCHTESTLRLGAMSGLTIHCAACHTFVAPVMPAAATPADMDAAILPDEEECLSCHLMRARVHMPSPDPHRGVCASCHNPHEQSEPSEAAGSCGSSGCHEAIDRVTGFHRGLQPGVLEDCLYCHQAHSFAVDGSNCGSCHERILQDSLGVTRPRHAEGSTLGGTSTAASAPLGVGVGLWAQPVQNQPRFLHSQHRAVDCGSCHESSESHGALRVRSLQDCRSCHHTEPLAATCDRCHDAADMPAEGVAVVRSMELSVGTRAERSLTFPHQPHVGLSCGFCHNQGLARVAVVDCSGCHEVHHGPEADCTSCHEPAPTGAHPPERAHVTCSGSGCHTPSPFQAPPRTRQVCLACHQDKKDHNPDRRCAECHTMPSPRGEEANP